MNKKSIISLLVIAIVVGIFCFLFLTKDQNLITFSYTMVISLMYSMLLGVGNGYLNNFLDSKYSWTEETRKRTIIGIIATVIINIILVYICNYLNFIVIQGENPENMWNGKMNFRNWFFVNLALLISAILHAKGFMQALKNATKKAVTEQKIIASSANAQFESLKNQLDPHFLFNSLNVLSALIEENPDNAQKFTSSMSKIYRYVLEQKDKEVVSLDEEINFARTYIELLKYRFEDSIMFHLNIEDDNSKDFVVPLSLQLLLENCIKHNHATSAKPLQVEIFAKEGYLIIKNNLQKRELPNEKSGIGLSNIVQRYSLLTKRNVFIENDENTFSVKIPILTQKNTTMQVNYENDEREAYKKASRRVKEIKDFYSNLISYCCVIPFIVVINLMTSPKFLWFVFPMLGWGLGVAIHGFTTFGIGKSWEERKIQELMNKDKNIQQWK
ncbi:2TM domain-containing protein [Elizabethkingia anophelis]|uniref:2TM domain-containing protein n=2 Tax=Weeksellaceae TaxID=2762318 RepID=UPI0007398B82|nr:2TM domain-containing protein [Elizabethkingia anophelis]MDX8559845.1 2TM domain-containing protein [Elizabethkingia sp. HX ZCH]MDX8578453.1 2TM domain-containing protein [Elizabethkingia sp. HX YK]KUF38123.1 histidine kinase [Elizabethkingia anophelis]MCT3643187.1 2TM domain-containing protein [Elizabethkingia anophelis]MCT3652768.1 2TM domain-containing protein [Elizabethkingia anophelis]